MTAIQPYQQQTVDLVDYQTVAIHRLGEWAASAGAAYDVARRLVNTAFCPQAYRGKPEEATAAILAGIEMGLSPMSALRAFDVIQGQAAPRAITLRAVVQAHGHEIELIESTATRCVMRGRRKGATAWQTVTWTMDQARDLGLAGKDGWKKQPATMLVARATSALARLIASDAILGIGYSSEELADGGADEAVEAPAEPAPSTGTRRMSRRKPDPTPEPSGLDEFAPEPADAITPAQLQKLHICLNENGLGDRDTGLAWISDRIGREVASSKELTKREAMAVIDALEAIGDATPADPADGETLL